MGSKDTWALVGGNQLLPGRSASSATSRSNSKSKSASPVRRSPLQPLLIFQSDDDYQGYCNFQDITAHQLYAASHDDVWITTVLQLSESVDAIRHAVIALGSLSRRYQADHVVGSVTEETARFDRLALRNYQKSLGYLSIALSSPADHTIKETLVSCMLFSIIELLRGNADAVEVHVNSGSRLVQQYRQLLVDEPSLIRLFSQIQLLSVLWLGRPSMFPASSPNFELLETAENTPNVVGENGVVALEEQLVSLSNSAQSLSKGWPPSHYVRTDDDRLRLDNLQSRLDAWQFAYDIACPQDSSAISDEDEMHMCLMKLKRLQIQHLIESCGLGPGSMLSELESSTMLGIATRLLVPNNRLRRLGSVTRLGSLIPPLIFRNPGPSMWKDTALSGDLVPLFCFPLGAIEPLYYVATNASTLEIRLCAIELMERQPWREGGWDSSVMAEIARKKANAKST